MNQETIVENLYQAIQESPHQELLFGGLKMLTNVINGEEINIADLEQGAKTSGKIWADEMDQYLTKDLKGEKEEELVCQYISKNFKKTVYEALGHTLSEEDQQSYKDAQEEISKRLEGIIKAIEQF